VVRKVRPWMDGDIVIDTERGRGCVLAVHNRSHGNICPPEKIMGSATTLCIVVHRGQVCLNKKRRTSERCIRG
jgi:hypothetical protein